MNNKSATTAEVFQGNFIIPPAELASKLTKIRAYIFDWDGVFNNGAKSADGASTFNEVDSMGVNMLRYNHYIRKGAIPLTAVITGEHNPTAFALARREHFHGVYYAIKRKTDALQHFCSAHDIAPSEIAFFFDDIIDLEVAAQVGVRIMLGRTATPVLQKLVATHHLADYVTHHAGGAHGVREATELIMALNGKYDETIFQRARFEEHYRDYLNSRNIPEPAFYSMVDGSIIEKSV